MTMDIKQLLKNEGFRFNKRFGQNFLTDDALLEAICNDAHALNQTVLEIGAGAGTLTRVLSRCAKKVIAFEIDRNLQPVLAQTLTGCDNVQLVMGDIMKYPMRQTEQMCGGPYRVVANIPYYLTSPLIMRFVEEARQAESLTLTVQKEVAERLAARPATKEYGAITVAVQAVADVQITRLLSRELFFPVPNVDSAVVTVDFRRDKFAIADPALFRKTVRVAFSMRRKTLVNCIGVGFGVSKEQAAALTAKCGLSPNCRGEELSVGQFVALYKTIEEELK